MRVLASALLLLEAIGSGAAFWASGGAAFRLGCGFWSSASDTFRLWRNSVVGAAGGGSNVPTAPQQGAAPDRLQLRSLRSFLASVSALPAAGELSRCAAARGASGTDKLLKMLEKYRSRQIRAEIGRILLKDWDPIGVADEPEAQDEYESYVYGVLTLLLGAASEDEIVEHLFLIETERMGMSGINKAQLIPVAEKLRKVNVQP